MALVAIAALLLQTLAPFPVALSRAAAAPAGVPGWLSAHLCLADAVETPAHGTPHGDETPAKLPPLCPICLGLQLAFTTMPPSPAELAPPHETGSIRFAGRRSDDPSRGHRALAQARAPPSIA
jgi:hypothetical protein